MCASEHPPITMQTHVFDKSSSRATIIMNTFDVNCLTITFDRVMIVFQFSKRENILEVPWMTAFVFSFTEHIV